MRADRPYALADLVVRNISEVLAQDFNERQVWRHPLDVVSAASQDAPAAGRSSSGDLGEQARLSDPRLAADEHNAALASFRGGQPLEQRGQLTFTSNEGRKWRSEQGRTRRANGPSSGL